MTEQIGPGAGSPAHARRRDGRVFLTLAVICLILVGGLAVISHGAPSAAQYDKVALQTPVITPDEGCANFARFWTVDTGVDVPVAAIEGLTNCRLSDVGEWFVPDGPSDPRLSGRSFLTAQEAERVEPLRSLLMDDLEALEKLLPGSLEKSLEVNYSHENLPVFGHTKRGRTDFGAKHARYQRITQAFLLGPRRVILAEYVGWVMERRSSAATQFEAACSADPDLRYLHMACSGIRAEFRVSLIPILWDLTDPVLLEEYLVWKVRFGESLPVGSPTATIE